MTAKTTLPLTNVEEFVKKFDDLKKQDKFDLSCDQDLSFAIMNLISIEEHLAFSGAKTKNNAYYDFIKEVREMRKVLLRKLVKNIPEGAEVWCISKHLLAASMRLLEVGTKCLGKDNKPEAYDMFQKAFDLWALFWLMSNTDVVGAGDDAGDKGDAGDAGGIGNTSINVATESILAATEQAVTETATNAGGGLFAKIGAVVKKAVNCCLE